MNKLTTVGAVLVLMVFTMGATKPGCGPRDLVLSFEGLEALGQGYVYEGWLIVDGAPVSTGRFNLEEGQSKVRQYPGADVLARATTFVLTIEPALNDDPAPSATHVLAGDFAGRSASLTASHPAVFGDDFTTAAGGFILATPTTEADEDYAQGIWYVNPAEGRSSLTLPELPVGWMYEGWVATATGPVTTGKFTALDQADSDGAGITKGPGGFPAFPGQDFIEPALNLIGATAVISIEPDPDDSGAPFALKPLVGAIVDAGQGVLQPLSNNAAGFATGSAAIR